MIKKWLPALIFCFFSFAASAGVRNERIANFAFNAPQRVAFDKRILTAYLVKPYHNDYDKLQSIAYWIASHIAYDGYKYSNGRISEREIRYEYDVLRYRTGICSDFARLFAEMADIAGISGVEYVSGVVLENQNTIKRRYSQRDTRGQTGHAWNRVELERRKFFVDTTFMAQSFIGENRINPVASLKHKIDLKKRSYKNNVNTQINDFYFDFTPKQEVKRSGTVHLMDKYIY